MAVLYQQQLFSPSAQSSVIVSVYGPSAYTSARCALVLGQVTGVVTGTARRLQTASGRVRVFRSGRLPTREHGAFFRVFCFAKQKSSFSNVKLALFSNHSGQAPAPGVQHGDQTFLRRTRRSPPGSWCLPAAVRAHSRLTPALVRRSTPRRPPH